MKLLFHLFISITLLTQVTYADNDISDIDPDFDEVISDGDIGIESIPTNHNDGANPQLREEIEAVIDDESEEEMAQQLLLDITQQEISLCKNGDGSIKNQVITLPEMPQHKVDCRKFVALEYELIENQDDKVRFFSCATRGWDQNEAMAFAEELGVELEKAFECPGKKQNLFSTSCLKDVACNVFNTAASAAEYAGDLFGFDTFQCPETSGSNCMSEALWGFFGGLLADKELIWQGMKWAGNKMCFWCDDEPEDATSEAMLAASGQEDSFFDKFKDDPAKATWEAVTGFVTGIGNFIGDAIGNNFACAQWAEPRYTAFAGNEPKCLKPLVSFECATCGQAINMACGVVGFLGKEVVIAALTGGMANVATKVGSAAAKAGLFVAKKTRILDGAKYVAGRFSGIGNGKIVGVLSLGGKKTAGIIKWAGKLAIKIGNRIVELTPAMNKKLLAMLRAGKELSLKALKPAKWYLDKLDEAFILGYQGRAGVEALKLARSGGYAGHADELNRLRSEGISAADTALAGNQKAIDAFKDYSDELNRVLAKQNASTADVEQLQRKLKAFEDAKAQAQTEYMTAAASSTQNRFRGNLNSSDPYQALGINPNITDPDKLEQAITLSVTRAQQTFKGNEAQLRAVGRAYGKLSEQVSDLRGAQALSVEDKVAALNNARASSATGSATASEFKSAKALAGQKFEGNLQAADPYELLGLNKAIPEESFDMYLRDATRKAMQAAGDDQQLIAQIRNAAKKVKLGGPNPQSVSYSGNLASRDPYEILGITKGQHTPEELSQILRTKAEAAMTRFSGDREKQNIISQAIGRVNNDIAAGSDAAQLTLQQRLEAMRRQKAKAGGAGQDGSRMTVQQWQDAKAVTARGFQGDLKATDPYEILGINPAGKNAAQLSDELAHVSAQAMNTASSTADVSKVRRALAQVTSDIEDARTAAARASTSRLTIGEKAEALENARLAKAARLNSNEPLTDAERMAALRAARAAKVDEVTDVDSLTSLRLTSRANPEQVAATTRLGRQVLASSAVVRAAAGSANYESSRSGNAGNEQAPVEIQAQVDTTPIESTENERTYPASADLINGTAARRAELKGKGKFVWVCKDQAARDQGCENQQGENVTFKVLSTASYNVIVKFESNTPGEILGLSNTEVTVSFDQSSPGDIDNGTLLEDTNTAQTGFYIEADEEDDPKTTNDEYETYDAKAQLKGGSGPELTTLKTKGKIKWTCSVEAKEAGCTDQEGESTNFKVKKDESYSVDVTFVPNTAGEELNVSPSSVNIAYNKASCDPDEDEDCEDDSSDEEEETGGLYNFQDRTPPQMPSSPRPISTLRITPGSGF